MTIGDVYAHVKISPIEMKQRSYQILNINIPHVCEGYSTTTSVELDLPSGIFYAKPKNKYGWTISTISTELADPVIIKGRTYSREIIRVKWDGKLSSELYDDFDVYILTPTADMMFVTVNQICDNVFKDPHQFIIQLK